MEEHGEIIPSFPLGSRGKERKTDIDQKITHQPPKPRLGDPGLRHWEWCVCACVCTCDIGFPVLHNVTHIPHGNYCYHMCVCALPGLFVRE